MLDGGRPEDKDAEEALRLESVTAAVDLINNDISNKLKDIDPKLQDQADSVA